MIAHDDGDLGSGFVSECIQVSVLLTALPGFLLLLVYFLPEGEVKNVEKITYNYDGF